MKDISLFIPLPTSSSNSNVLASLPPAPSLPPGTHAERHTLSVPPSSFHESQKQCYTGQTFLPSHFESTKDPVRYKNKSKGQLTATEEVVY